MNIFLDNVNIMSTSGPNHFGNKLKKHLELLGHEFRFDRSFDIQLSFIQKNNTINNVPLVQRLDGIYFNNKFNFNAQNSPILKTYKEASAVIFQTQFNKDLIFNYFGEHQNYKIIRNGADLDYIENIRPLKNSFTRSYKNIWCCASSWRPHKRLSENIRYFLEHSSEQDGLIVAGHVDKMQTIKHKRIHYIGNLNINDLISVYKASDIFLHLAWLDHCPNVVVDALACGCKIICSSSGGTKEIAGPNAILIEEEEWDFKPLDLYNPPLMNFSKKRENTHSSNINMKFVANQYSDFLERIYENN